MPQLTTQQAFEIALQHHRAGQLQQAEALYRQILAVQPDNPDALHFLGAIAHQSGFHETAEELIRKSIALSPSTVSFHNNLGDVLSVMGRTDEAIACFQRALDLKGDYAEAHYNMGLALHRRGNLEEACKSYRRALEINPNYADVYNNLGIILQLQGSFDEAIAYYEKGLALQPTKANVLTNKGNALKNAGCLDEAIAYFRQALAIMPNFESAYENLIHALLFHPGYDEKAMTEELQRWNAHFAQPLKTCILPHANDCNPDRKLRIGYVSPDFCAHPVGRFLLPLLKNHDRQLFEVFAYSQVHCPDEMTSRIQSLTDKWVSITHLSDEKVANQIRKDGIDILVDLAMHTEGNRLLVFARKPAPVQVTWLAYCGSTGLETMDYRLSDPFMDPPGNDALYCEKTIRLETFWCFQPTGVEPECNPLPGMENGFVTFGCLNNFGKISEGTMEIWAKILELAPTSRLLIYSPEGQHRNRFLGKMKEMGIAEERLRIIGRQKGKQYFEAYYGIDIALDPFPHGGGTTTCDALWMGVPVVSLVGKTAVGRGGLSILSNIGLPEFVGNSMEEYVQIAVNLANNLPRLAELRSTLRQRMQASPLMDAPRFARKMEAVYREIWKRWCEEEILSEAKQ